MKTNFSLLKQIVFHAGKYNSNLRNTIQISKTQFKSRKHNLHFKTHFKSPKKYSLLRNTIQINKTCFTLLKHCSNFKSTFQDSKKFQMQNAIQITETQFEFKIQHVIHTNNYFFGLLKKLGMSHVDRPTFFLTSTRGEGCHTLRWAEGDSLREAGGQRKL